MNRYEQVIAIDGPAAAGKSTVARLLADRLNALLFDTGALYRAISLIALRRGIPEQEADALAEIARNAAIDIRPPSQADGRQFDVWLDGEDVTWEIRSPEIGRIVSRVSEHPQVRAALLPLQREIAANRAVVMVGRDIGTVVIPDAGLKIYLDASPEERARRRYQESIARGGCQSFAAVLAETRLRDAIDSGRATAPLRAAADAVRIETDNLSAEEAVDAIQRLVSSGEMAPAVAASAP